MPITDIYHTVFYDSVCKISLLGIGVSLQVGEGSEHYPPYCFPAGWRITVYIIIYIQIKSRNITTAERLRLIG